MRRDEVEQLVRAAVTQVVEHHRSLLDVNVSERALCHHLANYIAQSLKVKMDVDVEYNRHARSPKRLNLPPRDAHVDDVSARTVVPDIIVHRRGSDDANEVVLEVKKVGGSEAHDNLKLRAFRDELGYKHCGHVVLGLDADGSVVSEIRWLDGKVRRGASDANRGRINSECVTLLHAFWRRPANRLPETE